MADISKISPDGGTTEYNIKDATARTEVSTINGKIPSGASSSNKMATASDVADCMTWEANARVGARNILDFNTWKNTIAISDATATWRDTGVTLLATNSAGRTNLNDFKAVIPVKAGERLKFVWKDNGSGSSAKFEIFDKDATGASTQLAIALCTDEILEMTVPSGCTGVKWRLFITTNGQSANIDDLMCIPPDDTYEGYSDFTMTNKELTEMKSNKDLTVLSNVDLNNIKGNGEYLLNGNITSGIANYGFLKVFAKSDETMVKQIFVTPKGNIEGNFYFRAFGDNAWTSWYKLEGTAIS